MTLNQDEMRALASLQTIAGYSVLLDKVLKSRIEDALNKLKLAKGRDERADAGAEYAIWDEVFQLLRNAPRDAINTLQSQGDEIYG